MLIFPSPFGGRENSFHMGHCLHRCGGTRTDGQEQSVSHQKMQLPLVEHTATEFGKGKSKTGNAFVN